MASPLPVEDVNSTQRQQVRSLNVLVQTTGLLARNSQKLASSEPQESDRELFSDDDSFLYELSPVADREQSDIHEIDPPLPIRARPVRPQPKRFADIAADIAGTVEEDEHGEEHTEVDFQAAACLGQEQVPCYFKLNNNIRDFRLYAWETSAVTAAKRKWSANSFMMEKELITTTVLSKKKQAVTSNIV